MSSLSPQAQSFITQSIGASWVSSDFSPSCLSSLRSDNSYFGSLAWHLVQPELLNISFHDEMIGGVNCMWVSPSSSDVSGNEIVLFLFGGAFVVGSPEDDLSMTARIASCMGRNVCVPRYKRAPEHPYPAAFNEIMDVYLSLVKTYNNICIVGESAGGNLALGLVLKIYATPDVPRPFAVALLSPWIDLTHSGDSHLTLLDLDPTLSIKHFLEPASLAYAGEFSLSSPEISPLFAEIPLNFPPTLISTATRDLLLSDSTRLAKKLNEKNCQVDLRVAEGLWHVFEWYPECPEAVESLQEISSFLKRFCVNN